MPRPPQIIGCEQAAYEFLRLLNGWGRGILAGNASRGDTVQIKRKMDFKVMDASGWSPTKKVDIIENVRMTHEVRLVATVSVQAITGPLDEFTDETIRPIADRIGKQIKQAFPTPQSTLVMASPSEPVFAEGVTCVSFAAGDTGAGIGVRVSKAQMLPGYDMQFEFAVVFGFTGSAIKVADIFQSPNEKEIAALEMEKKRLQGLLEARATHNMMNDRMPPRIPSLTADSLREMMDEMIRLSPKVPWVTGSTINIKKPPRFNPWRSGPKLPN